MMVSSPASIERAAAAVTGTVVTMSRLVTSLRSCSASALPSPDEQMISSRPWSARSSARRKRSRTHLAALFGPADPLSAALNV